MRLSKLFAFAAVAALPLTAARADEGMWTIDGFPTAKMQADYGWAPDQAWLDKVRSAAVRLTGGCSASFVSSDGLILTNHHCGYDALVASSTPEKNYGEVGYKANNRGEELPAKVTLTVLRRRRVVKRLRNSGVAKGSPRLASIGPLTRSQV